MRPVSVVSTIATVLGLPTPTRSASKKVVGGDQVHQGETRRITVVGDGMDSATSVVSSDARIGVRLLSKKGLAQGRAKGQIVLEVVVPLSVPKDQAFHLTIHIAPNHYYAEGGTETVRLMVQEYPTSSWRPFFHFAPSWGWMNDPNGLVYVNGTYHLYYQAVPFSRQNQGQVNWGHATSKDLVHWSQHRDMMFNPPMDLLASSDDHSQVWSPFSGSAVVVSGEAAKQFSCNGSTPCIASIFTQNMPVLALQDQWLAVSCDGGESFQAPVPVLSNSMPCKPDFRDPKVFRYHDRWIMVLAVGSKVELYESQDLKQWEFLSALPLYDDLTPLGPFVETPDLIELPIGNARTNDTKWVLTYSEGFLPPSSCGGLRDGTGIPLTDSNAKKNCEQSRKFTSRCLYVVGEFDGQEFKPETQPRSVDFGPDFFAPQTWSNTPGRTIMAGWQNNWRYAHQVPTTPWRGQLSVPRELGLIRENSSDWLTQTPVPELAVLRSTVQREIQLENKLLTNTTPEELRNFHATAFDADLVIDVGSLSETNAEIKLHLRSGHSKPGMVLTWQRTGSDTGVLSLTRSAEAAGGSTSELRQPGAGFIGQWSSVPFALAPMTIEATDPNQCLLKLRILVDQSSVEVFAGDGRVALSSLFFPDSSNRGVKLYATGGTAKIVSLVIYPFKDD